MANHTLTSPEDFDIDQVFESKEDAESRAMYLNLETLEQLKETPPEDPTFENVLDLLRDMEDGGMVYDVHATEFFNKVNK